MKGNQVKQADEIVIFWFRRDLRLNDNHGLYQALRSGYPVLPVFIFDTDILDKLEDRSDARVSFIYDCLVDINQKLSKSGSCLKVLNDTPINAFKALIGEFNIHSVYFNQDYEPYAIKRDSEIKYFLEENSIKVNTFKDQVIFEKNEIVKPDGKPYTVFTPYANAWKKNYSISQVKPYPSENFISSFIKDFYEPFISLEDTGFVKSNMDISVNYPEEDLLRNYDKSRNEISEEGTSRLSIHLRFGTISIRELTGYTSAINEQFLNELIWREFFMMILYHFPEIERHCFKRNYEKINWRNNESEFELWCNGKTGYPLVDAGMNQLNQTGWMHNRVRMVTASFLVKHILIDWRWGEAYFAQKLLDYDLASNVGNWQWVTGCGCDAAPYFRIFNPYEQQKKFDPAFKYIRRWIPDFDNYVTEPLVEHRFARQRTLEIYKKTI